jgi:hypothetical protein
MAASRRRAVFFTLAVASVAACAQTASPNLEANLKGITKSAFLACSGPPLLDQPNGTTEQMSFITNLARGQVIGLSSPTALAPDSCSVDAVFANDRLASANFSGSLTVCNRVFLPCMTK